ncbi:MAG: RidA family protein [Candidatus Lambdaproteobacteria bacterium]|nr:RidA family protein [Candidatus Lambdaproteobacteria bacterium]
MSSHVLQHTAKPLGNYPHVKRVGDLIFVSGTSARRPDDTIEGAEPAGPVLARNDIRVQTRATLRKVQAALASVDAGLEHLVDLTAFLVNMNDFHGYNEVYAEFFPAGGPARTTVAVHQLPHPHMLIEIKAMAVRPGGG